MKIEKKINKENLLQKIKSLLFENIFSKKKLAIKFKD